MWKRYVNDTFVVTKTSHKEELPEHLSSLEPNIQLTPETSREDGSIPFFDTLVIPQPDKSLITTVYRKSTHTDLYLQWDGHLNLAAKYSVINTQTQRAKTVCSNPQLLKEEEDYLRQALRRYRYPGWALNYANIKSNRSNRGSNNTRNNTTNNSNKPHLVVPYIKGLSESCKNICSKEGIQMHFKGGTIKDRDTIWKKSEMIYR